MKNDEIIYWFENGNLLIINEGIFKTCEVIRIVYLTTI